MTTEQLIKDITQLLREMIMEQSRELQEMREEQIETRIVKEDVEILKTEQAKIKKRLNSLYTNDAVQDAVDEIKTKTYIKEEKRAYQERRRLAKKIFNWAIKLAGVAALVTVILERIL